MTATPHNGKEEDFQLFLALLDGDRFEGRFRDGVHTGDVSDLMRRMVKERLLKFDGRPLFPERIAYTVPYKLSDEESRLYTAVSDYVREEFDRADALANAKRAGTVGFALTILQRRLASSPEAMYRSLRRRRERLEGRLRELEAQQRSGLPPAAVAFTGPGLDLEDAEDLDDAPERELEEAEARIFDQATAARSIAELKAEIDTLNRLEALALGVRRAGRDTKWRELASLLGDLFTAAGLAGQVGEPVAPYGAAEIPPPAPSPRQKLVLFTEHRDTLRYLQERVTTLLGRERSVVVIHGGIGREERRAVQEAFRHDPEVQVLLATDAAGEGINLQRAHLMVNYDLPWNPNRLEQRFGRIHRIGQTEVCHLWNLVADDTREGDVYRRLLEKLEQARHALGGQVFDVLGKLEFEGRPLRDLLLDAVRYGERPEVRRRLDTVVDHALDLSAIADLLEERQLVHDAMDATRVQRVREEMERAEARRLQPHYVESFFREAFHRLGGAVRQREARRYQITHVPAAVRNRYRAVGSGEPMLPRYERIAFEKPLVAPPGRPPAAFVCPGHPLLDAVVDLTLERHGDLLRRGAVLVDERDAGAAPRVLFSIEHALQDGSVTRAGDRRVVSKRVLYVERDAEGVTRHLHYAPYLDYRPVADGEPAIDAILARDECAWVGGDLAEAIRTYAVAHVVPEHLAEVRNARLARITKTEAAVQDRLTKEISYWDRRAAQLKLDEEAGRTGARLRSGEARRRADALQERLRRRLADLGRDRQISPRPPVVLGGVLVVPRGLIDRMQGRSEPVAMPPHDTQVVAAPGARPRHGHRAAPRLRADGPRAREAGLRRREPRPRHRPAPVHRGQGPPRRRRDSHRHPQRDPLLAEQAGRLHPGHRRVPRRRHAPRPLSPAVFQREPDFGAASVNYRFQELLARAEEPR